MNSLVPDAAKYDLARQLQACQSNARRNGKVARLPLALRHHINQMLEDGLPYKDIIAKLGPAGQHLNDHNLSNWRLGGYQDYLKAQAISNRARIQTQAAAGVLRDTGHIDPRLLQRACTQIALTQYLDTLLSHGEQLARDSFKKNPAKFITLINACCNLSNSSIARIQQKWRAAPPATAAPPAPGQEPLAQAQTGPPTPRPSTPAAELLPGIQHPEPVRTASLHEPVGPAIHQSTDLPVQPSGSAGGVD